MVGFPRSNLSISLLEYTYIPTLFAKCLLEAVQEGKKGYLTTQKCVLSQGNSILSLCYEQVGLWCTSASTWPNECIHNPIQLNKNHLIDHSLTRIFKV